MVELITLVVAGILAAPPLAEPVNSPELTTPTPPVAPTVAAPRPPLAINHQPPKRARLSTSASKPTPAKSTAKSTTKSTAKVSSQEFNKTFTKGRSLAVPTLSMGNLCDEIARTSVSVIKEKAELAKQRKALDQEKIELQKISKKIAQAREQLRIETNRLISFIDLAAEESKPNSECCPCSPNNKLALSGKSSLTLLSKTIKSMKPAQAANLINTLDRNFGAALLIRMRPADASLVMNRLPPKVAAELMVIMAATPPPQKETKL